MANRQGAPPAWHSDSRLWKRTKPSTKIFRASPTLAESVLWKRLRNGRLGGHRFRRQHVVGQFVVDFLCWKARLVVEVDGEIHLGQAEQDRARQRFIESCGLRVLRFSNDQVEGSIDTVIIAIKKALSGTPSPTGEGDGG